MRRTTLDRPFSAGMVTDLPDYAIGPQNSTFAQDGYSPQGVFIQRAGWSYDGTTADVADNLVGIYRAQFALADVNRTITVDDDGDVFIHNASAAGTSVFAGTVAYLPRCVYHDELLLCAQDGLTPMRRYSGAGFAGPLDDGAAGGAPDTPEGEARIVDLAFASDPGSGSYITVGPSSGDHVGIDIYYRVLESSTSAVTLEDMRASAAGTYQTVTAYGTGLTYPAVGMYGAGTVTFATAGPNVATGYGTKWSTGFFDVAIGDGMLVTPPTGDAQHFAVGAITDDDTITMTGGDHADITTKSAYQITRQCPFKDVAAHKESLWGTGVAPYPNRAYVSPPGWNPSYPPGFTLPFDVFGEEVSANANDFLLDFVDVPTPTDGDHNVAILSSPNPLLVLKRHAVYGIFGAYGGLSVDMIADGIGCIDIRSAQSYDEGQFWAGETGIYWYTNGTIVDLTAGKINREWRELTREFDYGTLDYCSLGLVSGHLIVHITTDGGTVQRTYLCDLRDQSWQSRISNFDVRYMFSSRIPGEPEKLLAVSDDRQGRVLNFAPALDGSGTADDDAGSGPRLQAYTTTALGRANGIEGITRLVDLDVHANVYDAGAAGSTNMNVNVVSGGGTTNAADSTKALTDIQSDTVDNVRRTSYRVGTVGRTHQVRFDVDAVGTDTAATKVELHQILATVRDFRERA